MIERYFSLADSHRWLFVFLTLLLALAWYQVVYATFELIKLLAFVLPNRIIRSKSIRQHGWPPRHCDADGDVILKSLDDDTDKKP